jgi:hypothetical protein
MSGDELKRSESTKNESEKMPAAESKRSGIAIIEMIETGTAETTEMIGITIGIVNMIETGTAETTEMIGIMIEVGVEETVATNSTTVGVRSEAT